MTLMQKKNSHFLLISQATGHASWRGKWWRAATWWPRRFDLVDLHDLHLWKATWWPRRFGQIYSYWLEDDLLISYRMRCTFVSPLSTGENVGRQLNLRCPTKCLLQRWQTKDGIWVTQSTMPRRKKSPCTESELWQDCHIWHMIWHYCDCHLFEIHWYFQ